MSEQTEFLKDLEVNPTESVLDKSLVPSAEPEKDESKEDIETTKNRQGRRYKQHIQQLRDEVIAANAKLEALTEVQKFREEVGQEDYIKEVRAIYGEDEPGKKMASDILENTLRKIKDSSVQEALERFQEQQGNESEAVRAEERTLDEISDHWEDEYDIDMTDDATRQAMFTLTEKLSPKDEDGNIKEYADPDAVAEVFLSTRGKSNDRAKELASRSMTRSGASQPSKIEDDAIAKFLKENGIGF